MRDFWASGMRVRDFGRLNDTDHIAMGRLGRKLFNRLNPARKILIRTGDRDQQESTFRIQSSLS